jgi:thioredoxin 2
MSEDSLIVRCPRCSAKNRIPRNRWQGRPVCGKCGATLTPSGLYPDSPVNVSDSSFHEEVINFPGPVLAEFSAPW